MSNNTVKIENLGNLRPYSVPCHNFTDKDGNQRVVSAIIVPIELEKRNNKIIIISWACSNGLSCRCSTCRYSKVSRGEEYEKNRH